MHRRHFIGLAATSAAAFLFSRLTYAAGTSSLINLPDEVWAQTGTEWFKMKPNGNNLYSFNGVDVSLKINGDATGIYVQSPNALLNGIRLKWRHQLGANTITLGDSWERTYSDAGWKKPGTAIENPWYVLLQDRFETACFGVKTGCNTMCWWAINPDSIELTLDTHSGGDGVHLGMRKLHAADIITSKSTATENPFATSRRFCTMMCEKPQLPKQPLYGINDWYFAYGKNSYKLIKDTTAAMAELVTDTNNRPFSVVDAGWAQYSPLLPGDGGFNEDFSVPNDKFKDMHALAGDIKNLGMRPGLWMRPLCARHNERANLLAPKIPGRDDPKSPILDPTITENMERIKHYFDVYKQWGYEMVKHDFSTYDITGRWGFDMKQSITSPNWRFNDNTKTNAEIIKHLYTSIRGAAGDGIYINGCNTVSHLSAGIFEMCRIGDDTSGEEWARTRKMGINTRGTRITQHNTFYAVDGDCVGLTTKIPWDKNKQWMQLLAGSSAPLFISAQPEALGSEQKAFVK